MYARERIVAYITKYKQITYCALTSAEIAGFGVGVGVFTVSGLGVAAAESSDGLAV
jgi:hypothetical protein